MTALPVTPAPSPFPHIRKMHAELTGAATRAEREGAAGRLYWYFVHKHPDEPHHHYGPPTECGLCTAIPAEVAEATAIWSARAIRRHACENCLASPCKCSAGFRQILEDELVEMWESMPEPLR